ncbi:MAG: NAD(P)-dependent oxidoreductase [Hyphomicrobiaceae bacterium]
MAVAQPVGFVGIGNMGAPMVRCLAKAGHTVLAYDLRAESAAAVAASAPGIEAAASPADIAKRCKFVVTMLPESRHVRDAILGDSGIVKAGLAKGAIVIDMSSSFPLDTRSLGADLAMLGIGMIDAPVSGGVGKAVTGTLAIMTGGDAKFVDEAELVLKAMGQIHRTGALGSGHAMKALNNYVSAAGLVATAEALIVGQKFGLDGAVMTKVLNASTGRNNTTENKAERYMLSRKFDSGFALALMEKDVGMARRLAEELGLGADELAFVSAYLTKALGALGSRADHTAVLQYAETVKAK